MHYIASFAVLALLSIAEKLFTPATPSGSIQPICRDSALLGDVIAQAQRASCLHVAQSMPLATTFAVCSSGILNRSASAGTPTKSG